MCPQNTARSSRDAQPPARPWASGRGSVSGSAPLTASPEVAAVFLSRSQFGESLCFGSNCTSGKKCHTLGLYSPSSFSV